MSENLTRFDSERQRQDRRAAEHIKRAKQVERNRVEWCNHMYHAALAGNEWTVTNWNKRMRLDCRTLLFLAFMLAWATMPYVAHLGDGAF